MLRAVFPPYSPRTADGPAPAADIFNPLWFFLIVIHPVPARHRARAPAASPHRPGIISGGGPAGGHCSPWSGCFAMTSRDGALEQMMLMPHPLGLLALAKVIAHWLLTGLPLLLISRCWPPSCSPWT